MRDLDNIAAVVVLGTIGLAGVFIAVPASSKDIVILIAGGLIGYLAKTLQSPNP